MKTFLATATAVVLGLLAMPNTADAGIHVSIGSSHSYVSGYTSCGRPIYTKRTCTGYDRYHRPVYRYHRLPVDYRRAPVRHYHSPRRGYGYGHVSRPRTVVRTHGYSYGRHYAPVRSRGYRGGYRCR